jgi:helix-turn-helix protein
MTNKKITPLFCSLVLIITSCKHIKSEFSNLDLVKIHFVNRNVTTPFSVSCDNFETLFSNNYKTLVINDPNEINAIKRCLRVSNKISNLDNIDVRVKIYMYSGQKLISTFCFDNFENLVVDNNNYIQNACLVNLITHHIEGISK